MSFQTTVFESSASELGLGYNGVKVTLNYFDGLPVLQNVHSPELQLCFKSLSKRDLTTKEKAMAELLVFIQDDAKKKAFNDDILTLTWCQIYAKLISSNSKLIRLQAHQFTAILINTLGKKVSKFLRELVPLMLFGLYDVDLSVSKSCSDSLQLCFKDSHRINSLWKLFGSEILELVKQVIVIETPNTITDEKYHSSADVTLRYNQLMVAAIRTLTKLVSDEEFSAQQLETLHEIICYEHLWSYLNFDDTKNLNACQALLVLMSQLRSKQMFRKNKDALKFSSKRLLASLSQYNNKSLLRLSSITPDVLRTLLEMNQYKDGKFWTYDKNSKNRLVHFLSMGSGISDTVYYSLVYQLYSQSAVLDATDWLKVWNNYLYLENARRMSGRQGSVPLCEAWTYYLRFTESMPREQVIQTQKTNIMQLILTKDLQDLPQLAQLLSSANVNYSFLLEYVTDLLPVGKGEKRKELLAISNVCVILGNHEDLTHELNSVVLDSIEAHKKMDSLPSHMGFVYFDNLMRTNNLNYEPEISLLIESLPSLVSYDFFQLPMDLMTKYSNSKFVIEGNPSQVFDAFVRVLVNQKIPVTDVLLFLNNLNRDVLKSLISSDNSIRVFTTEFINKYTFDDESIFRSKLLTGPLLLELYDSAKKQDKIATFNEFSLAASNSNEAYNILFSDSDYLSEVMLSGSSVSIPVNAHSDEKVSAATVKTLVGNISVRCLLTNTEIEEFASQLNENSLLTKNLLNIDLVELFSSSIKVVDCRTSLTSPLGLLCHLFQQKGTASPNEYRRIIRISQLLDIVLSNHPHLLAPDHVLFITRCYELTSDFNYLFGEDLEYYHRNTLYANAKSYSLEQILSVLPKTNNETDAILNGLIDSSLSDVATFYNSKIIYRLCLNSVDFYSSSQFEAVMEGFDKRIKNVFTANPSEINGISGLYAILSSATKFNNDSGKLSQLRTFLLSQLVGENPRNEAGISKILYALLLLCPLMIFDSNSKITSSIDVRRLHMVLVSVTNWMQNDLWYEEAFNEVRLALLELFSTLYDLSNVVESPDRLTECSLQLLHDSLGFLDMEETEYYDELRYLSFRLLSTMQSFSSLPEELDLGSIIDASFIRANSNTMATTAYCKYFSELLDNFSTKSLSPFYEKMFAGYLIPNLSLQLMNALTPKLEILIKQTQQELVVEYELAKSSVSSSTESLSNSVSEIKAELPKQLLDLLHREMPQDYLEYFDKMKFMRYLNYCHLLSFFFIDISYDLRQVYLQQLKQLNLVNRLLDFLSDQMTLALTKYWDKISIQDVLRYPYSPDRGKQDPVDECNLMMEFLLYRFFILFGSQVSTWWNDINSRSFRESLSNFSVRYLSPSIISDELDLIDRSLSKFDKKDSNLSVKMNRNNNEIKASYLIDEQKLEISFRLPPNYPLQNVQVHGVSRVGVTEQQWKSWIVSTQRIITTMNGSIVDALEYLSKNVKMQFSGFEECAICYCVLHAIDRKLPTKVCPTCHNRFHGACLYKWFKSSGSNTCPLCRGEFNLRN